MFKGLSRAFIDPGCYRWQWLWSSWWDLRIHYDATQDVVDYGIPEYASLYPKYQVNTFCFSCFQAIWYSDYRG